jgi:hypothetical protein
MGVFGSLKRRNNFFGAGVIAVLVGTGFTPEGKTADSYPLPPSNRQVAENVLFKAVENLGIPEGKGAGILFSAAGTGAAGDILGFIAEEFLLKRGYEVHESGNFPEFRFDLDTLYVRLNPGGKGKKRVERFAEARISAFFQETESSRKVYNGSGIFEDAFPSAMIKHVGRDDRFVIRQRTLYSAVKPVFFGLIMTGLVWLLYSYRG